MEEVIKQKLNGKKPDEITDLHIEGVKFGTIQGLSEDFKFLEELELLDCGLKSLKGLPRLPSVKILLLGDNFLKGKEEIETIVQCCEGLRTLSLVGNRFESPDDFQPLTSLESFCSLDVYDCPLTAQTDYRDKLWSILPNLTILDGFDKDGKEMNEDDDEEEDEEEDEEGSSDEDVGLDYLQKEFSEDSDEEDDYNPEAGGSPPSDDHDIVEEEDDDEDDAGPSHKRPKLDPPLEDES